VFKHGAKLYFPCPEEQSHAGIRVKKKPVNLKRQVSQKFDRNDLTI